MSESSYAFKELEGHTAQDAIVETKEQDRAFRNCVFPEVSA